MAPKHLVRGLWFRLRFLGRPIHVAWGARVWGRGTIRIVGGGSVRIGPGSQVHDYAMLLTYGGHIRMGANCTVNPFCVLYGHGGLTIGNGVRIATHSVLIPANHHFDDPTLPIWQQAESRDGIVVEDDVWIGAGARVMDGVRIGRGSVVGAGAVVTKSLPPGSVAAGVPARVIGQRGAPQSPAAMEAAT
ncbi:MAG: acyltransferase [Verrucomicrobia bacterium]|nr:acyltransferase [Verrucomicrobiota bacterium]